MKPPPKQKVTKKKPILETPSIGTKPKTHVPKKQTITKPEKEDKFLERANQNVILTGAWTVKEKEKLFKGLADIYRKGGVAEQGNYK